LEWRQEERKKSPNEKLENILNKLNINADFTNRPFRTFSEIFDFRDSIAHGKSEYLESEIEGNFFTEENPPFPYTKWENLVSESNARKFMDDTDAIVKIIYTNAGFGGYHFDLGITSWWGS
jgi:hypothetical protein